MTPKPSPFSIEPVAPADYPALAGISGASMATDKHTRLKAAHPTKPYDHSGGMFGAFEYWGSLSKHRVDFVKAVDRKTGQILGFICWGSRLGETPSSVGQHTGEDQRESNVEKPPITVTEDYVKTEDPTLDALAQLEELTSCHLANYQKKIMPPGTRCMYVLTIAVHPNYQRRGVGTTLLKHGTDRADSEGVFCWIHASEADATTFRKCGFEVDETLVIDLDEPAGKMDIKPPAGQDNWGTYTFTYMVRQPRS